MKTLKRFNLGNVSDKISDRELKRVLGGYGGTGPNSPCYSSSGSCHSACATLNGVGICELIYVDFELFCACIIGKK